MEFDTNFYIKWNVGTDEHPIHLEASVHKGEPFARLFIASGDEHSGEVGPLIADAITLDYFSGMIAKIANAVRQSNK